MGEAIWGRLPKLQTNNCICMWPHVENNKIHQHIVHEGMGFEVHAVVGQHELGRLGINEWQHHHSGCSASPMPEPIQIRKQKTSIMINGFQKAVASAGCCAGHCAGKCRS